ncbi:MAG: hypothetical protein UY48_C0011G0030 [Candidatus Gottesmanbacteria bacterium GW2011_GWB1_49_7]|uniref:Uncharacterized protein n=1 Tax=Candidatus Gottesmanbacteria bacterium GW2011_GWB1_49_7 TaxID=1618448 RepID=A0A0G1W1H6_9BACT|nr:MAG: hypothetical protein UY48_C0011G0030 [Candidatus Gottesmanbacteria bacterium GW2011_GWB1_49_7]
MKLAKALYGTLITSILVAWLLYGSTLYFELWDIPGLIGALTLSLLGITILTLFYLVASHVSDDTDEDFEFDDDNTFEAKEEKYAPVHPLRGDSQG